MKTLRVPLALLMLHAVTIHAQEAAATSAVSPAPAAATLRTPKELEQLVAPIALYPDALIALILPATTVPTDIVLAARHVREFPGERSQIEHRAWDESVKSLTNYPEVLKWMDENLDWTRQLGEAFAEQPAEVMQAVQRLRAQARAAGTLVDTPQQQVLAEPEVIRIVPAQPDVIYVPHYQPEIVFVDRPVYYSQPFITFGLGVPVGSWLAFDCDWRRNSIWMGNRHRNWTGHDWRRPVVPLAPVAVGFARRPEVRQWRPPVQAVRTVYSSAWRGGTAVIRPTAFGTSSTRSFAPRSQFADGRRRETNPASVANPAPVTNQVTVANPHPRTFTATPPDNSSRFRGSRQQPAAGGPALPSPVVQMPPPVATVTPAPATPRVAPAPDWSRNRETRVRNHQSQIANSAAAAAAASSTPVTSYSAPVQSGAPSAPVHHRSYSRPAPVQPNVSPPTPSAAAPARSHTVAPAPAPQSAPAQAAPARNESGNERRSGRRSELN